MDDIAVVTQSTPTRELSLEAREISRLFPFFLCFDRSLTVTAMGPAIHKVCPGAAKGSRFDELFRVFRPRMTPSFASLSRASESTILLDAVGTDIRMRGQVLVLHRDGSLMFVGTPWFTDIEQLHRSGLDLKDFTVHDPNVDFLYMVQAKTLALEDARRLSETITRQRDDLANTNAKLAQALTVKTQFLANTSHELRTPLNGIIGMATLLTRAGLAPKEKNDADIILKSANSLLTIVNDILDFSKMEAGKLSLEPADFDLHCLAYDLAESLAVTAQSKNLELICSLENGVPHAVRGDPTRLRQIVSNLVGNAVKFTHKGEIVLRVNVVERSPETVLLRFSVTDTGPGISSADQACLFHAFSQVDGTSRRRHGGTGLGLAICKELAALMGGEIGVESTPGQGSTFWFTARLETVADLSEHLPRRADLPSVRALVVEDSATNRDYVLALLAHWGMRADGVADSTKGIELLHTAADQGSQYDVIIMDNQTPGMVHGDLLSTMTDDERARPPRVIMMSSIDQMDPAMDGPRADAYVTKPVRPSYLFDCIASLLGDQKLLGSKAQELTSLSAAQSTTSASRDRRVLIVDDNPVNLEVASRMVDALGYSFDVAENGRVALDALARTRYAAVLMDLQMPILDGYETIGEIRRREGGKERIPIIAVTAHSMESDRQRALATGADDYISKPVDFDALGGLLRRWLPTSPKPPSTPPPRAEVHDSIRKAMDALRRYQKPGESDIAPAVVAKFLSDLEIRVDVVRAADEARDLEAISRAAHALRSSSAIVGARSLSELCAELEQLAAQGDHARVKERCALFMREVALVRVALKEAVPEAANSTPVSAVQGPPPDPDTFFTKLQEELRAHPVLRHPFLVKFAESDLSRRQIEAFAAQHHKYSARFTRNLAAVIANTQDEEVRSALILNMYEELGEPLRLRDRIHLFLLQNKRVTPEQVAAAYSVLAARGTGDATVADVLVQQGVLNESEMQLIGEQIARQSRESAHTALMRRFLRSLQLTSTQLCDYEPLPETSRFIDECDFLCRHGHWLQALGAIGLGTECLVPLFYSYIHRGIERSKLLAPEDYLFWTVHIGCDDVHGANIVHGLARHATTRENQERIASGARRILDARKIWYDGLDRLIFGELGVDGPPPRPSQLPNMALVRA